MTCTTDPCNLLAHGRPRRRRKRAQQAALAALALPIALTPAMHQVRQHHFFRKHRGHKRGVNTVQKAQMMCSTEHQKARIPPAGMAIGRVAMICERAQFLWHILLCGHNCTEISRKCQILPAATPAPRGNNQAVPLQYLEHAPRKVLRRAYYTGACVRSMNIITA